MYHHDTTNILPAISIMVMFTIQHAIKAQRDRYRSTISLTSTFDRYGKYIVYFCIILWQIWYAIALLNLVWIWWRYHIYIDDDWLMIFLTSALNRVEWSTLCPGCFTPGRVPVPIVEEAGWASEPIWMDPEHIFPTRVQTPNRSA